MANHLNNNMSKKEKQLQRNLQKARKAKLKEIKNQPKRPLDWLKRLKIVLK